MKPRVDGMCDYCAVEGCASCGNIVDQCTECQAPRELNEFKQCIVPEAGWLWDEDYYWLYFLNFLVRYDNYKLR